jgi:hypothetical protein
MQAQRLRRRSLKVEDVSHTGTEDIAEERLWLVCQGRARSLQPIGGRQSGLEMLEA